MTYTPVRLAAVNALLIALVTASSASLAQSPPSVGATFGQVPIKGQPAIEINKTLFKARPIFCDEGPCGDRPVVKLKDICQAAICLPLEAKVIPKILGPDVLHWRIKANGSMAQYAGSQQLSAYAIAPPLVPIEATREDVKLLPIVGIKNANGIGALQYYVRTK